METIEIVVACVVGGVLLLAVILYFAFAGKQPAEEKETGHRNRHRDTPNDLDEEEEIERRRQARKRTAAKRHTTEEVDEIYDDEAEAPTPTKSKARKADDDDDEDEAPTPTKSKARKADDDDGSVNVNKLFDEETDKEDKAPEAKPNSNPDPAAKK